jgi:hypothetical protein
MSTPAKREDRSDRTAFDLEPNRCAHGATTMKSPNEPPSTPGLRRRTLLLSALLPALARAAPPQRNLLIELRETTGGAANGWNIRSGDASVARERPAQQLRVLNGASASLKLEVTRPLQVWQALPVAGPAGGAMPIPVPTTQWVAAGQRITVQPRWPGGLEPVSVEISAESSRFDPSVAVGSAELPQRSDAGIKTTVLAPLRQWVTLAASGSGSDDPNVVATGQAAAPRVLQLRVSLAP